MPFSVGSKVTISKDAAHRFGGDVGVYARRGVAGTVTNVQPCGRLGLRYTVKFPPKGGVPVWTELFADEMTAAKP